MGISGVLCVVHPASSRSAWYALPTLTLMWWIQGVTPATLTAVGLVRTTVCGPFQCGAKESCFQCLTTPDPRHTFVNLFPKGEWRPFLYKFSYLIYYLTLLLHLLWNLISPYLRQIYYGRGPPVHNFVWRRPMGRWGHPESEQSRRKQARPGTVSLQDPLESL